MQRVESSPFRWSTPVLDPRRVEDFAPLQTREQRVRGMFMAALARRLTPARLEALRPSLDEPHHERYLPFRTYPQADHGRVLAALAEQSFPGVTQAEALRRLAREDMATLADSTFGRVVMAMVGDAVGALLKIPSVYEHVAPGIGVTASAEGAVVTLDYRPLYASYAYQLGQVEGVVRHYGASTAIDVYEDAPRYHVRLVVTVD